MEVILTLRKILSRSRNSHTPDISRYLCLAATVPPVTSHTRSDGSSLPNLSTLFNSERRGRSSFIHPDGMHLSLKTLTCIEVFGDRVFSNHESGATNRENSVDYSILTPMEILQQEQERAIPN